MRWLSIAALLLTACGPDDIGLSRDAGLDAGTEPRTRTVFRFVADEPISGPRFQLQGELQDDLLRLKLVAAELDAVFGYRVWLNYPAAATLEGSETLEVLGSLTEARYAIVGVAQALSIGGTRINPSLGDTSVTDATLAQLNFRVRQSDLPAFTLGGVVARRSDGVALSVATAGGSIEQFEELVP